MVCGVMCANLDLDEVSLVVKHTFLELVLTPDGKTVGRGHSMSDSVLCSSAGLLSSTCAPSGRPLKAAEPFFPATPMLEAVSDPAMEVEPLELWVIDEQSFMQGGWTDAQVFEPCWMMPYADCFGMQPAPGMWEKASWESASTASGEHTPVDGSSTLGEGLDAHAGGEWRTTIMLRNLPHELTRDMLRAMLDDMGFCGQYDMVYLPVDFSTGIGLGYAFINVFCPQWVPPMWEAFNGLDKWPVDAEQACTVSWSDPHQGLASHIERYQNSPVMHPDVPTEWKPALFINGGQVPFPPPSKKIKAPKVRSKKAAA